MSVIDPKSELVALYLSECGQYTEKFERLILESDTNGQLCDPAEQFRLLHTLKGSSAMMEFTPLVNAAHSFEDILAELKKTEQNLSKEQLQAVIDTGLDFASYFREELARIAAGHAPLENERLTSSINTLVRTIGVSGVSKAVPVAAVSAATHRNGEFHVAVKLKKCPLPHIRALLITRSLSKLCSFIGTEPENIDKASQYDELIQEKGFDIYFIPLDTVNTEEVIKKISTQPYVLSCTLIKEAALQEESEKQLQIVTVSQSLVNELGEILGDMINTESALEACVRETGFDSRQLQNLFSTLRRAVVDANVLASQIGTHDVAGVFVQMQRAVRGMARDLSKDIKVVTSGGDVRVDKSIIELLSDSMIHIVRNAADHGIEAAEERQTRGKPKAGTITLSAVKKNDYLTVTVSDDGGGIDRGGVLDRAERQGKLTKQRDKYSDKEIWNLLLYSGVSTNKKVTQYSGRGVGLDTVVRRIRQVGGQIAIESREGEGTSFILKIPITLKAIDGIEISLMDGSEMIIPANAVRHISKSDSAPEKLDYLGKTYTRLLFPGQTEDDYGGDGYTLLFERDFGPYYIRAKSVSMMSSYDVKQMPEFIVSTLKRSYIYSGCVLTKDAKLHCVLDASRLIHFAESVDISERQRVI